MNSDPSFPCSLCGHYHGSAVCPSLPPQPTTAAPQPDWFLHSNRSWVCDPPKVLFEGGWEHRNGWEWGGYHWSSFLCGGWNSKPELYENGLYLGYTFGGFK